MSRADEGHHVVFADAVKWDVPQEDDFVVVFIEDAFDDGQGLIVCPTASPYLFSKGNDCLEQFTAMIETVLAYKRCS